jgi:hypothetical protein
VTPVILLVLVVLWIVVLAPSIWRKRAERRSSGSIDTFHRQLHLLERAGPKIVAPAYRLQSLGAATVTPGQSGYPALSSSSRRPNLVLLHNGGTTEESGAPSGAGRASAPLAGPTVLPLEQGHERYRRQQGARRRRDVLLGLAVTFVLTGLLGFVHSLRPLWVLTILAGVGIVAYVALVNYARSLESERHRRATRSSPRPSSYGADRSRAGYPGAWDSDEDDLRTLAPVRAVGGR